MCFCAAERRGVMDYERIKACPKVELHCHLDGSLSPEFVRERLGEQIGISDLQAGEDCRNLAEYLEKFDLPLRCLQDEEGLAAAGYDFLRTAAGENVRYVEVRFAPALCQDQGLTVPQVLEAVLGGLNRGREDFHVEYNVIVCAMRHHSEETNRKMLYAAREFLGAGVCAADLAGNEAAFPTRSLSVSVPGGEEAGISVHHSCRRVPGSGEYPGFCAGRGRENRTWNRHERR